LSLGSAEVNFGNFFGNFGFRISTASSAGCAAILIRRGVIPGRNAGKDTILRVLEAHMAMTRDSRGNGTVEYDKMSVFYLN
jgi:hypothetical protein